MFADRVDAGRRLAEVLRGRIALGDQGPAGETGCSTPKIAAQPSIVLGIPRGGVIVAAEVARSLDVPLRVAVAAKVGAPGNPEYAVGALAADGRVSVNEAAGFSLTEVEAMAGAAREKVSREVRRWASGALAPHVSGAIAILVDDGLATGLTARAAVHWLRREGAARVVVAAPVAPPSTVALLRQDADDVVTLETPEWFTAVGQFYVRFGQTEDAEVDAVLGLRPDADAITSP